MHVTLSNFLNALMCRISKMPLVYSLLSHFLTFWINNTENKNKNIFIMKILPNHLRYVCICGAMASTKQFSSLMCAVFHYDESTSGNCHCFIVHLTPFTLIRKPFAFTITVIIIFILYISLPLRCLCREWINLGWRGIE